MHRGAVLMLEDENVSRNTSYCRQKFLQQYVPVIFSVYLRCWLHKYQFGTSEFWDCTRHHWWLAKGYAHAQQSSRRDILLSHGMGHVKTAVLRILMGEATVKIFSSLNQIKSTSLSESAAAVLLACTLWTGSLVSCRQFMHPSPLKTFQRQIIVNYVRDSSTRDSKFFGNLTSRKMRLRSVLVAVNELLDSIRFQQCGPRDYIDRPI